MLIIILCIIGWIVCGALAVVMGGFVDRISDDRTCPYDFFFWIGPIGLFITLFALILESIQYILDNSSILEKLYKLGRG